jgi:two-component system, NtrC family, response regulator AtoC
MAHATTVLVVDDERLTRWTISQRLGEAGHKVLEAADASAARELVADADLVILDDNLADATGLEVMLEFRQRGLHMPVLMLTDHATTAAAAEAMRAGVWHCCAKQLDLESLMLLVDRALETSLLRAHVQALRARQLDGHGFDKILGVSPRLVQTKELMQRVAASPATAVLLTGESGTGKGLAAKAMHFASPRATAAFINITCSALQDTLLESELFGHERGAFTDAKRLKRGLLELADGGTVFLDGVGEISPAIQAKLLRFLEEHSFRRVGGDRDITVDVRVIAATHRDLGEAVAQGAFRGDLCRRLQVVRIDIPPLRDRKGDIPLLAEAFLDRFAARFGRRELTVDEDAMRRLVAYDWPGNVRELKSAVQRALLQAADNVLSEDAFLLPGPPRTNELGHLPLPANGIDLEAVERGFVEQALQRTGGNRTQAAKLLGVSRDQVRYRAAKFDL